MRRDRRAFVDIRVWWDNNQSDILMPIIVSTSLDYGKDKDFYFKTILHDSQAISISGRVPLCLHLKFALEEQKISMMKTSQFNLNNH